MATKERKSATRFLRVVRFAYCFSCRRKMPIKNPVDKVLSNGSSVIMGRCQKCGTKTSVLCKKIKLSHRAALRPANVERPSGGLHICCMPSQGGVRLPDPNCDCWCHQVLQY